MVIMKRFVVICLCIMFSIICISCGKRKSSSTAKKSAAADFSDENTPAEKKWTNEDGALCIIFGYGFNDQEFYTKSVQKLGDYYGLEENGGLIYPLHFPDDFKNGISGLRKMLEGIQIKAIIFLGAPDDTHEVLFKYQEMYGGELPFPVISLFPQDNILGQESTCSLIIDYERNSVEDKTYNEVVLTTNSIDAEQVFINTVSYAANLEGNMIKGNDVGAELKKIVEKIVGPDKKVHRYVDSGSGMASLNHYTLESR